MAAAVPYDTLHVSGLPAGITEDFLKQVFAQYAPVHGCKLQDPQPGQQQTSAWLGIGKEASSWLIGNLNGNTPQGLQGPVTIQLMPDQQSSANQTNSATVAQTYPGEPHVQQSQVAAQGSSGQAYSHPGAMVQQHTGQAVAQVQQNGFYTPDIEAKLDQWVQAKRVRDFAMSDAIQAELEAQGIDVKAARPDPRKTMAYSTDQSGQTISEDNLYIKGLPLGCTEDLVRQVFGQYGNIVQVKMLPETNMSSGQRFDVATGLVRMASAAEAQYIIANFNGNIPNGLPVTKPLEIRYAGQRPSGGAAQGSSGQVYSQPGAMVQQHAGQAAAQVQQNGRYTPDIEAKLDQWVQAKRARDFVTSDAIQVELGAQGIDTKEARPDHRKLMGYSTDQSRQTQSEDNLYVKGLPPGCTEDLVMQVFGQYGNVVNVKILPPKPQASGELFDVATGLVRMASAAEAQSIIANLNGSIPNGLPVTKPLQISLAGQRAPSGGKGGGAPFQAMQQAPEVQGPSVNLYMTGLPLTFSQDDVRQFFGLYGMVQSAKVLPPSGKKPAAPGFVVMDETNGKWCLENLNGFQPDGFTVPLTIEIAEDKNAKGKGRGGGGNSSSNGDEHLGPGYTHPVPAHLIGKIMGAGGSCIREIRETTGAKVKVGEYDGTQERIITIWGSDEQVQQVLQKVNDIIAQPRDSDSGGWGAAPASGTPGTGVVVPPPVRGGGGWSGGGWSGGGWSDGGWNDGGWNDGSGREQRPGPY